MLWFVRRFIQASLIWLGLAVTAGLGIAVHPAWIIYRPAHTHMGLLGFVAMMIFGFAYHVVPRFIGRPLYSDRLAGAHWWLAQTGLAAMVAGFVVRPHAGGPGAWLLAGGGALGSAGAYVFIWNVWRTMGGRVPASQPAAGTPVVRMARKDGESRPAVG
jgi:cbb3-type cytochrome oxidase subunit 1